MPTSSSPITGAPNTRRRPRVKLVQSVATGIELIDLAALPRRVTVCNAFGHETAIAEYILMVMLVWSHRFREIEGDFRTRSSWQPSWVQSGAPHGEILGSTVGIVGLGRVGYEVARRAAAFGCRIIAANRSAREPGRGVEQVFPLSELDRYAPGMRLRRAVHRPRPGDRGADRRAPARADEAGVPPWRRDSAFPRSRRWHVARRS